MLEVHQGSVCISVFTYVLENRFFVFEFTYLKWWGLEGRVGADFCPPAMSRKLSLWSTITILPSIYYWYSVLMGQKYFKLYFKLIKVNLMKILKREDSNNVEYNLLWLYA